MQPRLFNKYFSIAIITTGILTLATGIFILIYGKTGSFQQINGNYNPSLDFIFKYLTVAGDGLIWIIPGLYCIFFRRDYFIAILAGLLISTLLTQFLKRVVYPEELRPIAYLSDSFPVHIVEGIRIKRIHSFPSGHAGTAFTIALLIANIIRNKLWVIVLPVIAFLAGYSRVYLGQHYLTDVLAGMGVGIVSAFLSLLIFRKFEKNVENKNKGLGLEKL